jgi:hypothetical protein
MRKIVDSLRRYQKIMILVVAFGVISLYMLPVDKIYAQLSQDDVNARFDAAQARVDSAFNNGIDRVGAAMGRGLPAEQGYAIISNLEDQKSHVLSQLDENRYRLLDQLF